MYDCIRATGFLLAPLYFVSSIVVGQFICVNLILAIILQRFNLEEKTHMETPDQEAPETNEDNPKTPEQEQDGITHTQDIGRSQRFRKNHASEQVKSAMRREAAKYMSNVLNPKYGFNTDVLQNKSLGCIHPESKLRICLARIILLQAFEYLLAILYLLYVLIFVVFVDNPYENLNDVWWEPVTDAASAVFFIVFSIAVWCRIIVLGFFGSQKAYTTSAWNILEFGVWCSVFVGTILISSTYFPGD